MQDLYLSGRMQKPVVPLVANARVDAHFCKVFVLRLRFLRMIHSRAMHETRSHKPETETIHPNSLTRNCKQDLYLSGRMQKPVVPLVENARVEACNAINLQQVSAVGFSGLGVSGLGIRVWGF